MKLLKIAIISGLAVTSLVLTAEITSAQSTYKLDKHSVGGGGGTIGNENYQSSAIVGQPIVAQNQNDSNHVHTGFWHFVGRVATSVDKRNSEVPDSFSLKQNYPNPFNPRTKIQYDLPQKVEVRLVVYNLLGRRVATLVNETQQAGSYQITFEASNLASGVYIYRIVAGDFTQTRKMMLMK